MKGTFGRAFITALSISILLAGCGTVKEPRQYDSRMKVTGKASGHLILTDRETGVCYLVTTTGVCVMVNQDGTPYVANGWRDDGE